MKGQFSSQLLQSLIPEGGTLEGLVDISCLYNANNVYVLGYIDEEVNKICGNANFESLTIDGLEKQLKGLDKASSIITKVRDQALESQTLVYMKTTEKELMTVLSLNSDEIKRIAIPTNNETDDLTISQKPSIDFYNAVYARLSEGVRFNDRSSPGCRGIQGTDLDGELINPERDLYILRLTINAGNMEPQDKFVKAINQMKIIRAFFYDPLKTKNTYRLVESDKLREFGLNDDEINRITEEYKTESNLDGNKRVLREIPGNVFFNRLYEETRKTQITQNQIDNLREYLRPKIIQTGAKEWRNRDGNLMTPQQTAVTFLNDTLYNLRDKIDSLKYAIKTQDQKSTF